MTRSSHKKIESDILKRASTKSSLSYTVVAKDAAGGSTHNNRGTCITTFNDNQYGAYWNDSLEMVLWKRSIVENSAFTYATLTGKTISDLTNNHHTIGMGIDASGILHVNYGNQNDAINYFTMPTAESIAGSPSADKEMIAGAAPEDRITYHSYIRDIDGNLFFMFRGNDDSGNDDDVYMYRYSGSAWEIAPGTSTDGQVNLGSEGAFGSYFSRPFFQRSKNRFHFSIHWRDTSSSGSDTLQYCYYDVAAGEFRDSEDNVLTTPITKAAGDVVDAVVAADEMEVIIQRPTVAVDQSGRQYVCYAKEDEAATPSLQVFVARKVGSSWESTQVTNEFNNGSGSVVAIPMLLIDDEDTVYLIYKSPYNTGALLVQESSDGGATWSSSYGLCPFDVSLSRTTNLDFERWETNQELYFYLDIAIGENAAQVTTLSKSLYILRWDPKEGYKQVPVIPTGIRSNDDVYLISDGGQVIISSDLGAVAKAPVRTNDLTAMVIEDNGTSDFIATPGGLVIQNTFGSLSLSDSGTGATSFAPIIVAQPSAATGSLNIFSAITPANDTGTKACITIDARQNDDTALTTRPVAEIRNNGTTLFEIGTDGSLDTIETTSAPAAVASRARIFAEDNGGGKTRLMVQFQTGSAVQIGIEV